MSSGASIVFNDPRRFGYMKVIARRAIDDEPLLSGLGPEPLGNEFDAAMLARSCANKKTSLKAALLDQRVVAGLGNIYVCEALFRAHLSPRRLAATLATKKGEPTDHAKRLVEAIHAVLNQAIKAGGSSLRDHRQTSGELGYFQHSFQVYDREGETCQTAGCGGIVQALYPERPLDLLVPEVPEVNGCNDASTRPRAAGPSQSTGSIRRVDPCRGDERASRRDPESNGRAAALSRSAGRSRKLARSVSAGAVKNIEEATSDDAAARKRSNLRRRRRRHAAGSRPIARGREFLPPICRPAPYSLTARPAPSASW